VVPAAWLEKRESARAVELMCQCHLLRDIFGSLPFRAFGIDQSVFSWNDGCIVNLTQATYEQRSLPDGTLENARLAILADALEESGFADNDFLSHLRGLGPHVRGCHVLDVILGKT
jgi:hypothetical protein